MTSDKSYSGWYFLISVVLAYLISLIFSPVKVINSFNFFVQILLKILPIFLMVFVLMALTNYFISPKKLVKYLGKGSGIKGWLLSILGGIISTGPIYMWYPLLNDLQKKGMKPSLIATFLYNRAVKIPQLPMIVLYFGLKYTIVLTFVMMFISVIQGILVEKILEVKK